jgi:hypothetical protein
MIEINLPVYAINYIEYSDKAGLSETETTMINNEMDKYGNALISYSDETFFSWHPVFGLASECVTAYIKLV